MILRSRLLCLAVGLVLLPTLARGFALVPPAAGLETRRFPRPVLRPRAASACALSMSSSPAPSDGKPQVVVVGSCNYDQFVYVSEFPRAGATIFGTGYATGFGGKGANQW